MTDRHNEFYINVSFGPGSDTEYGERAFEAALEVFKALPEGVTVKDAFEDRIRQGDEGVMDIDDFVGPGAIYEEATFAASTALTAHWHEDHRHKGCVELIPA